MNNHPTQKNENIPQVSIPICTYNGERFLHQQLDSIVAQDYPNLEVIICDDVSADSTPYILKEYAEKFPFIKIHFNPQNLGVVKNCEKAMSLCSGEYISICDQDDVWLPHKISRLIENIDDASLIYAQLETIDEKNELIGRRNFCPDKRKALTGRCNMALIFQNFIPGNSLFFKRELLQFILPIPAELLVPDHWIAVVAASRDGVAYYKETLSHYREHQTNISLKNRRSEHNLRDMLEKKFTRATKIKRNHLAIQALLHALYKRDILPPEEENLIREFAALHCANNQVIYNRKLSEFMKTHEESFMQNTINKRKARRKFCRGQILEFIR